MNSLFNPADREALSHRLAALEPAAQRQWGKMDPAQMLRHCALSLGNPSGSGRSSRSFSGS